MIRSVEFALTLVGGIAIGVAWRSVASATCGLRCNIDTTTTVEPREGADTGAVAALAPRNAPSTAADADAPSKLWSLVDESQRQLATSAADAPRTAAMLTADAPRAETRSALDAKLTQAHAMWPIDRLIERYGVPTSVELGDLMHVEFDRTRRASRPSRVSFALQEGLVCGVEAR
jgi:hypothetical protein